MSEKVEIELTDQEAFREVAGNVLAKEAWSRNQAWRDRLRDENRHVAVQQIARWFAYDHLSGELRVISEIVHETAEHMTAIIGDDPQLTDGLKKLLEAKDCLVRAAIAAMK